MEWKRSRSIGEDNFLVETEYIDVNGIPALHAKPKIDNKVSTIFYYHGYSSSPINQFIRIQLMAMHGIQVIAPFAKGHGKRGKDLNFENPDDFVDNFWGVIKQNIDEFDSLYKYALDLKHTDINHMGIYGNSMGAITSGYIYNTRDYLKACALTNGALDWDKLNESFKIKMEEFKIKKELNTLSIKPEIKGFVDKSLYMMGGDKDELVLQQPQIEYINKIKSLSKKEEHIRYESFKDLAHYVTIGMLENTINYFRDSL